MSQARRMAANSAEDFVEEVRRIVGASHVFAGPADMAGYVTDWTGEYSGDAVAVVRPADVDQVSRIVKLCGSAGISIIPQGGNTSLAGGAVPSEGVASIILSLGRMQAIRQFDEAGRTVVAEAGVVLETLQAYVVERNLQFPLTFGAKGSCTIGGNLATNAGGSNVVRYGNTRELCLGIEAVMPDGSIFNGLTGLRKDNTGYDFKDLLIGSEGTLGIITAAVFKLYPRPLSRVTAFLSMASVEAAIRALNLVQDRTGHMVEAFEYFPQPVLSAVEQAFPTLKSPLQGPVETGVLLEVGSSRLSDARTGDDGSNQLAIELLGIFEELMETGDIVDAVIAQSEQQRADLWQMRELVLESIMAYGASYHFDISLPLAHISRFLTEMDITAAELGFEALTIGHLGDGNLHYALVSADREAWNGLPLGEAKARAFELLRQLNGSFSAEHGIGQSKLDVMRVLKEPAQLNAMRAIKRALDPDNMMNPGRLIPAAE